MIAFSDALNSAWPVLMEAIRMRRTVTYSELAGRAGPPLTARAIHRQFLNPLSVRCRAAHLPDLTALVVRKSSGLPGGGWFDPKDLTNKSATTAWAEAVLECYSFAWPKRPHPGLLAKD